MPERPTVASVNEKAKSAHKRIDDEAKKHEEYRDAVHKRIDRIHADYNKLVVRMSDADNENARRIDVVENSLSNIDKIVEELKVFGKEVTAAINEMKTAVSNIKSHRTWKHEAWILLFQLAAFCVALTVIWKFVIDA